MTAAAYPIVMLDYHSLGLVGANCVQTKSCCLSSHLPSAVNIHLWLICLQGFPASLVLHNTENLFMSFSVCPSVFSVDFAHEHRTTHMVWSRLRGAEEEDNLHLTPVQTMKQPLKIPNPNVNRRLSPQRPDIRFSLLKRLTQLLIQGLTEPWQQSSVRCIV